MKENKTQNKVDEALVELVTKSLGYTENNGKPNLDRLQAGKTGELKSIFQYLPETWKDYSKQVAKKVLPNNPDNEVFVTKGMVRKWLEQGMTPEQIASKWNSNDPDAYKGTFTTGYRKGAPARGRSSKNPKVMFDVPKYVANFQNHFKALSQEMKTQSAHQEMAQNVMPAESATSSKSTSQSVDATPAKQMLAQLLGGTDTVYADPVKNAEAHAPKQQKPPTSKNNGLINSLILGKQS